MGFAQMSVEEFTEVLASEAPTPGGGSASALAGALAGALAAMVARTTAKSKKFADRAESMEALATEADALRRELLALADEDARAFDLVMAAFRMSKETADQQAERSRAVQEAYKAAVEPPLRLCGRAMRLLELALQVAEQGTPSAASDAGVSAVLAGAALEGGALNVRINLGAIKDEAYRAGRMERLRAAETQGRELRDRVLAAVQKHLA